MNQSRDTNRKLVLNKQNFDIALSFNYVGTNSSILTQLDQYFFVSLNYVNY